MLDSALPQPVIPSPSGLLPRHREPLLSIMSESENNGGICLPPGLFSLSRSFTFRRAGVEDRVRTWSESDGIGPESRPTVKRVIGQARSTTFSFQVDYRRVSPSAIQSFIRSVLSPRVSPGPISLRTVTALGRVTALPLLTQAPRHPLSPGCLSCTPATPLSSRRSTGRCAGGWCVPGV